MRKRYCGFLLTLLMVAMVCPLSIFAESSLDGLSLADINYGSEGAVTGDLNLNVPAYPGIEWVSDTPNLVDNQGKILTYDVSRSLSASLTARYEGAEKRIPFEIVYPSEPLIAAAKTVYWSENFEGETSAVTGSVSAGGENGKAEIANGALTFATTADAGTDVVYLAKGTNGQTADGTALSFEFTIAQEVNFNMQIGETNASNFAMLTMSGGILKVTGGGSSSYQFQQSFVAGEPNRVTIALNFTDKTFCFWLNGEAATSDMPFRAAYTKLPNTFIRFWALKNNAVTCSVDNICVFQQGEKPLSDITRSSINHGSSSETATRNLVLSAANGVSWSSTDFCIEVRDEIGILHPSRGAALQSTVIASKIIEGITFQKSFDFTIPMNTEPIPQKNDNGEDIYLSYEDFEGETSTVTGNVSAGGENGKAEIANGALTFTTTAGAGTDVVYLATGTNGQTADGTVLSFDFTLAQEVNFNMQIGEKNTSYFAMLTMGSGILKVTGGDSSSYQFEQNFVAGEPHRVTIALNFTDKTFCFWLNGEAATSDMPFRAAYTKLPNTFIRFWALKNNAVNCSIDTVRVYEAAPSPQETVQSVMASITELADIATLDDGQATAFAVADAKGCSIYFSAAAEGLVDADGTVHYPFTAKQTEVTVTAENEGYRESKTFPVTIAGNYAVREYVYPVTLDPEGDYVSVKAVVRDQSSAGTLTVLVGVYDGDRLIASSVTPNQDVTVGCGGVSLIGEIPKLTDIPSEATVKTFIWNSASGMRPVVPTDIKQYTR